MIPLSIPHLNGNEWKYMKQCLDTGWVSSAGAFVGRFEQAVAEYTGAAHGVAVVNGTAALHLMLKVAGVGQDDYVLMPDLTFVATANAVLYTGASPIFIDVDKHTWQIDLDVLAEFLIEKTYLDKAGICRLQKDHRRIAAFLPVHVLGNMPDMHRLMDIAKNHQLLVLEDAAESLGSTFQGRHAGTFGRMAAISFNGNKIITTGGGGVILTDDETLARQAKHLSTQAKPQSDEYYHDQTGYNYRLVNVLAALGVAQLEQLPAFLQKKKFIDQFYRSHLKGVGDLVMQEITPEVIPNNWLFTLASPSMRPLLQHLTKNRIQSRPFWVPMHQLPMYREAMFISQNHHSDYVYNQCLSIPCSVNISEQELQQVVDCIHLFFDKN